MPSAVSAAIVATSLNKLNAMIGTLGNNLQEPMNYFDISVQYTTMINTLTEKNGEEIRTYQAMLQEIKTFYTDLDSMSDKLTGVSSSVDNQISQLEEIIKSSTGK